MIYFFFDIDGTLLLSGGAGRTAMQRVMVEMYGINELPALTVHGRTDRAIIIDLFKSLGLEFTPEIYVEFTDRYHVELQSCIGKCRGSLLDGVAKLLNQLSNHSTVALGLLTGNSHAAAMTKVNHFGIETHFSFGGFGQEFVDRSCVARSALENCRAWADPVQVEPLNTWVVGDTVNDVRCARAIGANVIAVATGGNTQHELKESGADIVLPDFKNPAPLLAICDKHQIR